MAEPNHPKNVHSEEVKQEHVSHWDRDYLPTEELEAQYRESKRDEPEQPPEDESAAASRDDRSSGGGA
ncbi:hypothetical protein KOR34_32850 [Posidoniimonas corsicana]|uniref:Uncharacterized protein n=1 Tax=Posidoniimonas corsicana TaxID=1938618 RepID=A0A5C5V674_9BACT|nr:hypothetical protein [Posidoniimonas corsicana]TWT33453.1 hypothetical protein KOR34_32850 [Posidoniimonas corsicana]